MLKKLKSQSVRHSGLLVCLQFRKTTLFALSLCLFVHSKGQVEREVGSKWLFTGSLNFSQFQIRDSFHSIRNSSFRDQKVSKSLSLMLFIIYIVLDIITVSLSYCFFIFLVFYLSSQLPGILLIALFKYLPSIFCPSCHRAGSFCVYTPRENISYMRPYMGSLV